MMSKLFGILCAAGISASVSAQDLDLLPISGNEATKLLSTASQSRPEGLNYRWVYRMFNNKNKNHFSYWEMPRNWGDLGWKNEGLLGYASLDWFEGARPLFWCYMTSRELNWDRKYFTSNDPNCEGQHKVEFLGYFIGYVASTQLPGTVPLRRCYIQHNHDHFDTLTENCEGAWQAQNETILGYIFL